MLYVLKIHNQQVCQHAERWHKHLRMYPRCSTLNGCLSAAAVGYSPFADKASLMVLANPRPYSSTR